MLSFLKLDYRSKKIEFHPGKEHKSEKFLDINPLGQLPVLSDANLVLRDAQAILVYLARKYDKKNIWNNLAKKINPNWKIFISKNALC